MAGKVTDFNIAEVIKTLKKVTKEFRKPGLMLIGKHNDPFMVLISCIISLRTRDEITETASARLFSLAKTPAELLKLTNANIVKAIYPAAFFRNKTKSIIEICEILEKKYAGIVPDKLEELLKLKGVGRKTANLTLTIGHNKPGICVDIHVHRISNRWGYVKTKTPDETEMVLRKVLPKRFWKRYNELLVSFGQNLCKPISPFCSSCPLEAQCLKVGIEKHR